MIYEQWEERHDCKDPVWLLQYLKVACAGLDVQGDAYVNAWLSMKALFNMHQKEYEDNDAWVKRFKAQLEVVELAGADNMFEVKKLVELEV